MHKFQIEVATSLIRAEHNAHTDMIKAVETFKEHDSHQDRIGKQGLDAEELLDELMDFATSRETLPFLFLDKEEHAQRLVVISNVLFINTLDWEIREKKLELVIKNTISAHDLRFRNLAILAIECTGAMGNGYVVLRAWENIVNPAPPKLALL